MTDVQLTTNRVGGKIVVNGIDMSAITAAVTVEADAHQPTRVIITLGPGAEVDADLVGADVTIVESQPDPA